MFKKCAIKVLNPIATALKYAGCPLLEGETFELSFPLFVSQPDLDTNISSDDYVMSRPLFHEFFGQIRRGTEESYLEAAKILFRFVLSAFLYNDPDKIKRVRSLRFTILTQDGKHHGIQYALTRYINDVFRYFHIHNVVALQSFSTLSNPVNKRNMTILVTFSSTKEDDSHDPWEDLGYAGR